MEIKVANSDKMSIMNPDDVFELMQIIFKQQNMFDLKAKEHLWVIARNIQKKIVQSSANLNGCPTLMHYGEVNGV